MSAVGKCLKNEVQLDSKKSQSFPNGPNSTLEWNAEVSGVTKTVNLALYALNLLIFVLKQNGRGILALYHAAITERLKIMY